MKFEKYSPLLLRTAIAVVFLWFGFSQIKNPASWTRMIPEFVKALPLSETTIIYSNGVFELVFATLLLLGIFTRTVSAILGLHLLHICYILGYGAAAARDFSLALATFAIFLHGSDDYCLDRVLFEKSKRRIELKLGK